MVIDPENTRLENLRPYVALIEKLVDGEMLLGQFERLYFDRFKNDRTMWDDPEFRILNALFLDLDSFNLDPNLLGPGDLNEGEVLARISAALEKLKKVVRFLESDRT